MVRGIVAVGVAALVVVGLPVAAADVVVDGSEVTATRVDDGTTAEVALINTGAVEVDLSPEAVGLPSCTVTAQPDRLPPLESTSVTLTLEPGCPTDALVTVDLLASGTTPTVDVQPDSDDTVALGVVVPGAIVGLLLAAWALWMVESRRREVVDELNTIEAGEARTAAWQSLTNRITAACAAAGVPPAANRMPTPPGDVAAGWQAPLTHLDAGWKFSDAWLANANLGVAGVVTFLSTTDLLDAVVTKTPATVTATIAIAAALGLLGVALANAVLKVVGKQSKVPTVGGFAGAAALSVLASTVNLVTIARALSSMEPDLGLGELKEVVVWGAVVLVLVGMMRYVWVSVREVLSQGLTPPSPPGDPDVVRAAWVLAHALDPSRVTVTLTPWDIADVVARYGQGAPPQPARPYPMPDFGTSWGDDLLPRRTSGLL